MARNENWMNRKWRPAMGWMYMAVCIFDFILFPIMWAVFKAYINEKVEPWEPLTLQGAGLFHMAMGAVLGIAAWSRGREKMELYRNGYDVGDYPVDDVSDTYPKRKSPSQPEDEEM